MISYNRDGTVTFTDDTGEKKPLTVPNDDDLDARIVEYFGPPAVPVPASVSPANFCIALDQLGLLDEVEAYVATLPRAAQIKWQRATSIDRGNPLIAAAAEIKQWSVEQVDEVFHLAASM